MMEQALRICMIGLDTSHVRRSNPFGAVVHREHGSHFVDVYAHDMPYYACLPERIKALFRTVEPDVAQTETLQVIRFIEAANESRACGAVVRLKLGIVEDGRDGNKP